MTMPILATPTLSDKRPDACKICGTQIFVKKGKGNILKLCPKHREEHEAKKRAKGRQLSSVRAPAAPQTTAPTPIMPATSSAASNTMRHAPKTRISSAPSFDEAVSIITESMRKGEGYRHGWLGNTGAGKTVGIRAFLRATDTFTLIHDDTKIEQQYGVRSECVVTNFMAAPDDAQTVLFRGDPYKGTTVEVEPVADLARKLAIATRQPVRIVVDELDRACSDGGKTLASASLRTCLTQGRSMGISVVWSTQAPQRMPREIVDQSSTIALCQLGPRALNYLDERLCFDRELLDVVPRLNTFEFVLYESGKPWNGRIYRSPLP